MLNKWTDNQFQNYSDVYRVQIKVYILYRYFIYFVILKALVEEFIDQ